MSRSKKRSADGKRVQKTLLFVDAVSGGIARLITESEEAFEIPASLLPDGTREGGRLYLTAESTEDGDLRGEIDSLLSDLGDNP